MIERRALPQTLINFTVDPDANGIEQPTFSSPIDIKGDLQPSKSSEAFLQAFGLDKVPADMRIDFVPIRYCSNLSDHFLLGGSKQSIISNGLQYYEVVRIHQWSKHWELLVKPWTGAPPV